MTQSTSIRAAFPHPGILVGAVVLPLLLLTGCDPDRTGPLAVSGGLIASAEASEQTRPEVEPGYLTQVESLATDPRIRAAFQVIEDTDDRTMEDLVTITEIPAPPFMEDERAEAYVGMLREAGLDEVYRDDEGNAIGVRPGTVGDRLVVISAHLDTVFPEGTDVTVEFRNGELHAPGVGDDSRGLSMLLAIVRAMEAAGIRTEDDVWFVGTVGEEGLGDLRGVKHLFRDDARPIDAFLSVDGPGDDRIVNQALGSLRYRVTFAGPGGHSWGDFGMVNPAHALGEAIGLFTDQAREYVRDGARTSYNVGRIGGGTSINSVPVEAWMEVDLRSIDPQRLDEIGELFERTMREPLETHNARQAADEPGLRLDLDRVGDRPSGAIPADTPLIQRAMAAVRHFGGEPELARASTDANVPISLGVPAATVGRGGIGGGTHSLDEWWNNVDGHLAIQRTLLLLVAEAGLDAE